MTAKARTLADFRAAHDPDVIIPNKISAALAAIAKKGREHFEYEEDFAKLAGVSLPKLAAYRSRFEKYIVMAEDPSGRRTAKRAWFGDASVAKKLRGE